jgi:hypothetical protein
MNNLEEGENKKQIILKKYVFFLICASILTGGILFGIFSMKVSDLREIEIIEQENTLLKTILKTDKEWSKISIESQKAENYYDLASMAYEDQDFRGVERNCKIARGFYSEESRGYRRLKAELNALKIEDNLISIYVEMLDAQTEMSDNMFEACEHFESASRYYYKYYNTNVPYDDLSYSLGTTEIKTMGGKIRARDDAVEKYNNLMEKFRIELDKKI